MHKQMVFLMDSAEASLVEKWMEDGSLPNLRRIRDAGAYGRLSSEVFWMAGLPWFPLYTGRRYEKFPLPYYLVWNPRKMTVERPSSEALSLPVFWRTLKEPDAPRAVVIDMPFVTLPEAFNGVEIAGWATYDTIFENVQTYPPDYREWIRREFGGQIRYKENSAPVTPAGFLRIRDQLLKIMKKMSRLSLRLLQRERWDLFMVSFSTVHTAGHKLWDLTNVTGSYSESRKAEMRDALRRVYMSCDEYIGAMLAACGEDVNVIVTAIHGMEENITRNEILPEMLRRVLENEHSDGLSVRKTGWLPVLRKLVPADWRHAVKSRLPMWMQDRLTFFWRAGRGSWDARPAITLPADGQGMIRINLKGREARGIVEPGPEFEALCARITEGLLSFVDADSGEPLIQNIARLDAVLKKNESGVLLDCYPDLTVDWTHSPARLHRAIRSLKFGTIPWPTPHRNPEGRSGNHRMQGFVLAAGPDIKSGTIKQARMIDLAPTILKLLGRRVPEQMDGRPLDILA